jgi:hypothetical protein
MVSPVTITMPNYPTSNKEDSEIASQIDIRTDQKFGNTLQLYNFLIFRETTLSSIAKEIANIWAILVKISSRDFLERGRVAYRARKYPTSVANRL